MTASGVELESRGRLPLAGGRTCSMPNLSRKPLLSIDETAILLGENRATCYRAIKTGTFPLPVIVLGGRLEGSAAGGRAPAGRVAASGALEASARRGRSFSAASD